MREQTLVRLDQTAYLEALEILVDVDDVHDKLVRMDDLDPVGRHHFFGKVSGERCEKQIELAVVEIEKAALDVAPPLDQRFSAYGRIA